MAVDIGPKIGIDGEAEYRREINQIITQAKTLSSEMRKVESSFAKEATAEDKAAKKAEVLNKQIEVQKQKVEKLTDMFERAKEAKGEDAAETQKWAQALNNAEADLNKLEKELQELPSELELSGQAFQRAGEKMQKAGDAMAAAGSKMTRSLTAPLIAMGTAVVKIAADFDAQMSKVQAISGSSADQMDRLAQKARELGENTKFSATEVGQAYEYMAMAGWKTEDMLSGVAGLLDLAAASGQDLASTSDIVTDALTAFNMSAGDAQHFADVMAAASSNANTNVAMMGETFKYVAPVAGALAYSVEDVAIAVGLMANSGIKSSQAGTALRSILSRMASPAEATADAMERLGVSLTDEQGTMKSMRKVMDDLRAGFAGLSETEKTAAASAIAGKNGMSGLLAIVNASAEDYEKLAEAIDNADGAASQMAKTMQDNLEGRLIALKSKAEELAIGFGTALMPTAEKLVDKVGDLVEWLNELSDEEKDQIIKIAAITAAAGPALSIIGKTTSGIGKLVEGAGKMTETLGKAAKEGSTFASSLVKAGPLIGGIAVSAATAAAAYEIWKNSASGIAHELDNEANALSRTHEENNQTIAEMDALVERVKELAAKEALSNDEKEEMISAVAKLNQEIPDLDLAIDSNTGKLDANSQALLENADAALTAYKIKKKTEELEQITEKLYEAEQELAKVEEARTKIQQENERVSRDYGDRMTVTTARAEIQASAEEKLKDTQKELYEQYNQTNKELEELRGTTEGTVEATEAEKDAMDGLAAATTEDVDEIKAAEKELAEAHQKAYESAYQSITSQQGLFEKAAEAQKASAEEMSAGLASQAEAYANYAANLSEAIRLANESSNPYFAAIVQSIADMGTEGAGYLQELIDAANTDSEQLNSILSNYGNMEENKQKLAETMADISTGTAFNLSGLTSSIEQAGNDVNLAAVQLPENMAQGMETGTQSITSAAQSMESAATDEPIAAVKTQGSAAYSAGQNVADNMSLGLKFGSIGVKAAAMKLGDAAAAGAEAAKSYRARFYEAGRYLSEGLAQGMESQLARIQIAAAKMAAAADEAVRAKGKISSPSKVMMELGQYMGEGLALGMENSVPRVSRAGELMADAAIYAAAPGIVSGATSGAAGGNNYDYGGFSIVINGAQGQDVNALADIVSKKINNAMRSRRAVFA